MDSLIKAGRDRGPIAAYRAVVLEADDRITFHEFADLGEAKGYANDCASESDDVTPIAIVLDRDFRMVHKGRPYFSTG